MIQTPNDDGDSHDAAAGGGSIPYSCPSQLLEPELPRYDVFSASNRTSNGHQVEER